MSRLSQLLYKKRNKKILKMKQNTFKLDYFQSRDFEFQNELLKDCTILFDEIVTI